MTNAQSNGTASRRGTWVRLDVTFWISVFALLTSIASVLYNVATTEIGVLYGPPNHSIEMRDRLEIRNGPGSLTVKPDLLIENRSTKHLRINKIRGVILRGTDKLLLDSRALLRLNPKSAWRGTIVMNPVLSDGEWSERDRVNIDVLAYLNDEYRKRSNQSEVDGPIFVTEPLLERMKKVMYDNIAIFKEDDKYRLLLAFWVNEDGQEPSIRQLYGFKISNNQIRSLSERQLESLRTPRPEYIPQNRVINYFARPLVSRIEDEDMIKKEFSDFLRNFRD